MNRLLLLFVLFFSLLEAGASSYIMKDLSPQPRQAYIREVFSAAFSISPETKIHLDPADPQYKYAYLFNEKLKELSLDTLAIDLWEPGSEDISGIYIGTASEYINYMLDKSMDQKCIVSESYPGSEGYVIDVLPSRVIIAGSDKEGIGNGIYTFLQVAGNSLLPGIIFASRIIDVPEFPVRWFYYPMNIQVGDNVTKAKGIWKTARSLKLNGVNLTDYKFNFISSTPDRYFDSLNSLNEFCEKYDIDIIPGVFPIGYSNGIMFHNPNLAAGLPVHSQKFYIEADTGRLVPKVDVSLSNGGFEEHNGNNFPGFLFIDKPGEISFVDYDVKHSGNSSIRMENLGRNVNARVCFRTKVEPFTYYHISGYVKTDDVLYPWVIRLNAIGNTGRTLIYNNLNIPATTDGWMKLDICFNSLDNDTLNLYWGSWSAPEGKIWWDDISFEEVAFVNMLRRPGTPVYVWHPVLDLAYEEGKDYDSIYDPMLGMKYSWPGEYSLYHQPPTFRIRPEGNIKNGDTMLISYYHTVTIYDGQAVVSMSEPELYDILESEFKVLDSILKPETYFMNHDEIRIMNWDYADQSRGMSPAEILADNTNRCYDIIKKYSPDANIYVWSDMYDTYHNAQNNYYLVYGVLSGVADMIKNDIGIVNWNSQQEKSEQSLEYFERRGFSQISAPYYDSDENHIRKWKERSAETENFDGMMYTTWKNDYSKLEAFAEYSWNHAPYIYHYPAFIDTEPKGKFNINYEIYGDKYDIGWSLTNAKIYYRTSTNDEFIELQLGIIPDTRLDFELELSKSNKFLQYYITASDNRGWTTKIPYGNEIYFEFGEMTTDVSESEKLNFKIYPNPAREYLTIEINNTSEPVRINLIDILGNTLNLNTLNINGIHRIKLKGPDGNTLNPGLYFVQIMSNKETKVRKLFIY